jgi:dolichyl-phosphate-mannose-protein mannosyltransferase
MAMESVSQPGESVASASPKRVRREERIEYRDPNGNILDEEQVESLKGKVRFETRYETRTRVVDAKGNKVEIPVPSVGWSPPVEEQAADVPGGVAPPHPDVHGVDPETKQATKRQGEKHLDLDEPIPEAEESVEGEKEKKGRSAKPASEGNEATKEL